MVFNHGQYLRWYQHQYHVGDYISGYLGKIIVNVGNYEFHQILITNVLISV